MLLNENGSNIEELLEENRKLKTLLNQTKNLLSQKQDDFQTLHQIHESFKLKYDQLTKEKDLLIKKNQTLLTEKSDLNFHLESAKREYEGTIEAKQIELEKFQKKVFSADFDKNSMQRKATTDLQVDIKIQLEAKEIEIGRLKDQIFTLKRENEMHKNKVETLKLEMERDILQLKERHKAQMREIELELTALERKGENNGKGGRELLKEKEREIDDLKKRLEERENSLKKFKKEKGQIIDSQHEKLTELFNEVDYLKGDLRNSENENNLLKEKNKIFEKNLKEKTEEFGKFIKNFYSGKKIEPSLEDFACLELFSEDDENKKAYIMQLQDRCRKATTEKNQMEEKMREDLDRLNREIDEIHEGYKMKISEMDEEFNKKLKEMDRRWVENTPREIENENDFSFHPNNYRNDQNESQNKFAALSKENALLKEQVNLNLNTHANTQPNVSLLSSTINNQNEEIKLLKRKNKKLKNKLESANEKIMALISEKIVFEKMANQNKENNKNLKNYDIDRHQKKLDGIREIIDNAYPQLTENNLNFPSMVPDYNGLTTIDPQFFVENQIIRENAKIFSQNLLANNL